MWGIGMSKVVGMVRVSVERNESILYMWDRDEQS
jgi:hypothetical protein